MDWFARAFLKSSLAWLGAGVTLGVVMAVYPPWIIYRPAHMHMNLLGFVSMMIFGVAYHVIPRFTGHQLHSRTLAGRHWWIANIGLLVLVVGFSLAPSIGRRAIPVLATGGVVSALSAYAFIYNMWRTIDAPDMPQVGAQAVKRVRSAAAS
jgi:heme/copper-type cytochrome/quinol oxidase subunit 1